MNKNMNKDIHRGRKKRDRMGKDKDMNKEEGRSIDNKSIDRGIGRGGGKGSFHNPQAPRMKQRLRVRERIARAVALMIFCNL